MYENILTLPQFIEKNKKINRWPHTMSSLFTLHHRRKKNKMEDAFTKVGGRIMVDEKKFYEGCKSKEKS